MGRMEPKTRQWVGTLLLGVCVTWTAVGWAQEESAPPATPPRAEQKEATRPRARLPMYFAKVVTPEQRARILEIQERVDKQVADLLAQVKLLSEQRDKEVRAVLTPEQQQKVDEMVADARKRRMALRGEDSPEPTTEPAAAPPESTPPPSPPSP